MVAIVDKSKTTTMKIITEKCESFSAKGKEQEKYQPHNGHPIDGGDRGRPEENVFEDLV